MFSLISKIIDYFLGESQSSESAEGVVQQHSTEQNEFPSIENTPFFIRETQTTNVHAINGQVTHVFGDHGMVNGNIYFVKSDVQDGHSLTVGDRVEVKAVQLGDAGGWCAQEIVIIDHAWESQAKKEIDLNILQGAVVVGKVTFFCDNVGTIDNEIDFALDDCKMDYTPMKGDWVTANVEENNAEIDTGDEWCTNAVRKERRAHNIHPSRQNTFEGVITGLMKDHGYVDGQIYFERQAVLTGYTPGKNDPVRVLAIESSQGKCEWRALSIVPLSSQSEAYRSRQFQQPAKQVSGWLVPGQKLKRFQTKNILPVKLPPYVVPEKLEEMLLNGIELSDATPYLTQELTLENYERRMSFLLHLEEIQMHKDIRQYDMNRVCLHPVGELLALTVPGLAEGRPSVLIGDKIILSSPSDSEGPCYEGYVHEMTCTAVHLKFSPEFHSHYNGEDYNVEFTFSRTPLRRCHHAVSMAVKYLGSQVLFPVEVTMKKPQVNFGDTLLNEVLASASSAETNHVNGSLRSLNTTLKRNEEQPEHQMNQPLEPAVVYSKQDVRSKMQDSQNSTLGSFNNTRFFSTAPAAVLLNSNNNRQQQQKKQRHLLGDFDSVRGFRFFSPRLNQKQKLAVIRILLGQGRPMPYVIFGPPGTGKTVTAVEAILQILIHIPSSRILACTPSNSAADLIAERLHLSGEVQQTQMVRLNAYSRNLESIPECILKYCRFDWDLQKISHYRVIISTCSMAGSLFSLGLSAGHFTHVFVDECGQATEPESLIPIGLISGTDGQIVLAGDSKQLGPIIMSPFAKMYGLELSLLERIMYRRPYLRNMELFSDDGGFDSLLVTMLVNNYRSHPAILDLPSRLFYYSQLQPSAHPSLTHTLATWAMLPQSDFPVVFHGLRGEDVRENNSPSWFNPCETVQVVTYLQGLLREGINPDNIGIITPYRKQVEKIHLMMHQLSIPDVKVGSVEEFQGQERQVIIISTVRSNEKLVGFDIRYSLGFLSNPKRFNVSITRAQALLIIVGNPYVLAQDQNWCELIEYCVDNGGYTGCDLPDFSAYQSNQENCPNAND